MDHNYYVYVLSSTNGVLYVGMTNDLVRRVSQHKQGEIPGFTKRYNVDRLVYFEHTHDVDAAIAREKQIKGFAAVHPAARRATQAPRAGGRPGRAGAARSDAGPDMRPLSTDPDPSGADREAPGGSGFTEHGWERYYRDRGIRVETMVPARELTAGQARAAVRRMVPALAALAARVADADRPAPLALEGPGGTVVFLPEAGDAKQVDAWATFRAAIGL